MKKIKVLIVDDQELLREGLKTILSTQVDIDVVALACNGAVALDYVKSNEVDVVLMDIRMPKMDGVKCTQEIMKLDKQVKVLILTTFDDDDYIIDALSYGASGYLLKDIDGETLIGAVRNVVKGNILLPSTIANKIASNIKKIKDTKKNEPLNYSFTSREKDIISLLIQGCSNKEIAKDLYLTEGTIKNYLSGIYSKLEINDRAKVILLLQQMEI